MNKDMDRHVQEAVNTLVELKTILQTLIDSALGLVSLKIDRATRPFPKGAVFTMHMMRYPHDNSASAAATTALESSTSRFVT